MSIIHNVPTRMDIVDGCYSWYNDPACGTRSENNWVKNIGSALGHNDVNDVLQRGGGWLTIGDYKRKPTQRL